MANFRKAHSVEVSFITMMRNGHGDNDTMSQDQRVTCTMKNDEIKVKDLVKKECVYRQKIVNFDQIHMDGMLCINRHQFANIISLEINGDTKFLKFDSRRQMEEWYSHIMKPLRRLGWLDEEPESIVDGMTRRRATNPEMLRRPPKKPLSEQKSAFPVLEGGFPKETEVYAGVFEEKLPMSPSYSPSHLNEAKQTGSNLQGTGCSLGAARGRPSRSSGDDTDAAAITTSGASGVNIKNIKIDGNHNILLCPNNSEINFQHHFDTSMTAEIADQVSKQILPQLTKALLNVICNAACSGNNQQNQAVLQQLSQIVDKIEANGGLLYKIGEGSIVFFIGFATTEDLERFWKAYESGKLAKDIAQCSIIKEMEYKEGRKLGIQLTFQKSEYRRGLDHLDENKHTYMNVNSQNKIKPETMPKRKESNSDSTKRQMQQTHRKLSGVPINDTHTEEVGDYIEPHVHSSISHINTPSDKLPYKSIADPELKTKLENVFKEYSSRKSSTSEDTRYMPLTPEGILRIDDYDHVYHDIPEDGDFSSQEDESEEYEEVEDIEETGSLKTPKSKSLHISSFQEPSKPLNRQQTVPSFPTTPSKAVKPKTNSDHADETKNNPMVRNSSQPKLPCRKGECLEKYVRTFQKELGEDLTVQMHIKDARRLVYVKVEGLTYIWLSHWESTGNPLEQKVHPGDQIREICGLDVDKNGITLIKQLMEKMRDDEKITLKIRRAPHAMVLRILRYPYKNDLGIEIDENEITKVSPDGLFSEHSKRWATPAVKSTGEVVNWAITEINMQPVNYSYSTEQIQELLDEAITEVALVIQPSDLIFAMKKALQS